MKADRRKNIKSKKNDYTYSVVDDVEAIYNIYISGITSIRKLQAKMGGEWTYYRARNAVHALRDRLDAEAKEKEKKKAPKISHIPTKNENLKTGVVHRFILSGAQDDTPVFEPFLRNLEAYAAYINAKIYIGGYTYQLGLFEDHAAKSNVYDVRISQYLEHDRVQFTRDLLYLGNANVLPTAANPLNGWMTANGGGHVVIPHSRIALESIPRMMSSDPRYAVTTGTVTEPNYTPRAAGQKSLSHHTYGALVVEIDVDGEVFMRHVIADEHGNFQDLDVLVENGVCETKLRVKAIVWGDIHHEQLTATMASTNWGYCTTEKRYTSIVNILDGLQPETQFLHDTLDFRRRNHHNDRDPHIRSEVRARTNDNVESEVAEAANFVNNVRRSWCKTVVVESNHDAALARWLKNKDGQADPENAYYWHELNAIWHRLIREDEDVNIVETALKLQGLANDVDFVQSGGSYLVDDIECGLHGDLGTNGSRGSPAQYRRMGVKTCSGHTHSPKIVDGSYVAGVSAAIDQGYNKGPTTWAHAHIIIYAHGARTLLCMTADGRFRAMGDREMSVPDYSIAA